MEVGAYRVRLEYDLLAQLLPLSLAASRLSAADVSLWSLWSLDGPLSYRAYSFAGVKYS